MEQRDTAELPPAQATPSPVAYTAEEVAKHFDELLSGLDFKRDLRELGIHTLSVFKRRKALLEMTALAVSLWRLALKRSFPQDADAFFTHFMDSNPRCVGNGKKGEALCALIVSYGDLLAEKRESDFSAVARHMADSLGLSSSDDKSFYLKISLRIRQLYTYIFDRLI